MVDLSAVSYRVVAIDETGKRHNISGYVQNLGWEENRNEISVRSSFAARNDRASEGYLAGIIKPGCLICIYAAEKPGQQVLPFRDRDKVGAPGDF